MDKNKAGAIAVAALMVGTVVVPDHEQKHIEQRPATPEPTLTTEAWFSTASISTATTLHFTNLDFPE